MHDFVRKLITEWRRLDLPFEGETFVVAISGGADSVSLLLALHDLADREKLRHRFVAAHFNHKLRGAASDHDEDYVRNLASRLKIELAIGRSAGTNIGNIEQNARDERYGFLTQTASNLNAVGVLTAHTINDQAETFLLNLVRGSGLEGLSAMRSIRRLNDDSKLIRPLLGWAKRKETEGFCRDLGVDYCYDTMNEDTAFKRVRIRKILLPLLEDLNPNIVETLAATAGLMQNALDNAGTENRFAVSDEIIVGDVTGLAGPARIEYIRAWIGRQRGSHRQLALKHIVGIERLLMSTKSGRMVEIPGGQVVKTGGRLRYRENKVEKKGPDI